MLAVQDMLGGRYGGIYEKGDLYELGHEVRTVLQTSLRGKTIALFSNPYTASQLYNLGLRPETAFGCALNYLFQPLPDMHKMFEHELAVLQNPAVFTIGLQIRCDLAIVWMLWEYHVTSKGALKTQPCGCMGTEGECCLIGLAIPL